MDGGNAPPRGPQSVAQLRLLEGAELANPLDPGSEATGNTRYVLNEIYESPDGIADHWQQAQASWADFGAMVEMIASCNPQSLHTGEVAASLW